MDATYANEMQRGAWAEINPDECACRGRGYMGDDFDCWWRCPLHGHDLGAGTPPHPEDEERSEFDFDKHLLLARREAYRKFRESTGLGIQFHQLVFAVCGQDADAKAQVKAAEEVATRTLQERADERAQSEGFSCDLERRLDEEAAIERRDRR